MYEWNTRNGMATYQRKGEGETLIILPGVMADATDWVPVAQAIDLPNPIVIVNRRGRAPSPALGANYGVATEIADLAGIIGTLEAPVHLFGWSYGGLIAIEAALNRLPLRSLIAYEPVSAPFAPEAITPIRKALLTGDTGEAVTIINRDVSGFDETYLRDLRNQPVWPHLLTMAESLGDEMAAINAFPPRYESYDALGAITTLIVGAMSEDHALYGAAFHRFAQAMPQAHVETMQGQGHLAHVDDPAALGVHITRALKRSQSASCLPSTGCAGITSTSVTRRPVSPAVSTVQR